MPSRGASSGTNVRAGRRPGRSTSPLRCSTSPSSPVAKSMIPNDWATATGFSPSTQGISDRFTTSTSASQPRSVTANRCDPEDEAGAGLGGALVPCELGRLRRRGDGRGRGGPPIDLAARHEQERAERDQDGDGALHRSHARTGRRDPRTVAPPGSGASSVASRAAWTSTSTRGRSSSGAPGSPSRTAASRRPGRGAPGRRGARRACRRQGAGAHRRAREGRGDQARGQRARGGGAGEGDPRPRHPRARRPQALDRACVRHREGVLPLAHVRPRREEGALHVHDAGRRRDRAGRGGEPRRARAAPRRPARGLPSLAGAAARLRRRRDGPVRAEADRGDRREALRGVRRASTRCSARSTR